MMPKVTNVDKSQKLTVHINTTQAKKEIKSYQWWKAPSKRDLNEQMLSTCDYLKTNQVSRQMQAGQYARLYGNQPLYNFAGSNLMAMNSQQKGLPVGRPTMNVIQSCIDTIVSRITQNRPRPTLLTDGGDWSQRKTAKDFNKFIMGEFYQLDAYQVGEWLLRDAAVLGTGCLKVYEDNKKVAIDRILLTELLVDFNESVYGKPRQLFHFKLMDRTVLAETFPNYKSHVMQAEQAYVSLAGDSDKTISDQVMVIEGWRLPSHKDANDGVHAIGCTGGLLFQEDYNKESFPFVFLHSSSRMMGFWGQGTAERLMGTQLEITTLLTTISSAINLVGVPRVFIEEGSKIVSSHLDNQVGSIIKFRGTPPEYVVAPCMPQEVYAQLQRLVEYAYQQEGISTMAATSEKPAGLDSGEAIRSYDNLQIDRMASLARRYDNLYIDLAYLVIEQAREICEREGSYETVYVENKNASKIKFPDAKLLDDVFVIQCFDSSSLPREPAGRLQKITEMMQSGLMTPQEGRRLLDFPDLEQDENLVNAAEERILQILDEIAEHGKYTSPDPFMNLSMAMEKSIQYINFYGTKGLGEERMQLLRTFVYQVQAMLTPAPQESPTMGQPSPQGAPPIAVPAPRPQSDTLPLAG